jgi:alpha-ketoglutarate-dependent taurine dioxygenase
MAEPRRRDLVPAFGSEITGVDLHAELDDHTVAFLREVFDERGLLLFRDLEIDREVQFTLTQVLRGHEVPTPEERRAGAAAQGSFYISNKRERSVAPFGRLLFHADGMWTDEPFEVLSLHAEHVEPPVPATSFASATGAWATLPDDLRARVVGVDAVQVGGPEDFHEARRRRYGDDVMQTVREDAPSFAMPIARPHPRTGATILNASENHTKEIVGLSEPESDELLEQLFAHLYRPENTYEHAWRTGDLVIWDNLALQHARPNVTVEGSTRTLAKMGLPVPTSAAATNVKAFDLAK